jgi:hypothetical protein
MRFKGNAITEAVLDRGKTVAPSRRTSRGPLELEFAGLGRTLLAVGRGAGMFQLESDRA